MDIRRRRGVSSTTSENGYHSISDKKEKKEKDLLGLWHWIFLIFCTVCLYHGVEHLHRQLPEVLDASNYNQFSETRARYVLRNLTDLGPKPVGSKALQVDAVNVLRTKLDQIKQTAESKSLNRVEIDTQCPTGCFELFPQSFTLCYHKVTNIVARIGPAAGPAKHALLLNCHYDTVIDSPGANDDGTACAVMMDILEVLAHSNEKLEHDVVFLFNGAEEYGLQAAHGFIDNHPWRHTLRAFINLESCGSGGREVLFQSGPGSSWLLQTYIENAPHPFCTVLGQELFSAGAVPSDTDFRIFRDYGRISGLDLAYIKNGWVYHTEFDEEWRVDAGSLQRNGENVLAVVRAILAGPYLSQPATFNEANRWVYYDVVGLFSVHYSVGLGYLMNYGACALVLILISYRVHLGVYRKRDIVMGLIRLSAAFLTMVAATYVMMQIVNKLDVGMSWYKDPQRFFPMYALPIMLAGFAVHSLFRNMRESTNFEKAQYDCILITYATFLFILSYLHILSACFVLIHVVLFLLRDFVVLGVKKLHIIKETNSTINFVIQLCCVTPLIIFTFYMLGQLFETFVPILGRAGARRNPELVMGTVGLIVASNFVLFLHNLVYVTRRMTMYFFGATLLLVTYYFLLTTTSMKIPYEYDVENPKLRRIIVIHTNRTIFDLNGEEIKKDNGLFVQSLDYRNTADLPHHKLLDGSTPNCTGVADIYCQLPYYNQIYKNFPVRQVRWVPVEAPVPVSNPMKLNLLSKNIDNKNNVNCTFEVFGGSDKMSLHLTPLVGHKLIEWSFTDVDMKRFGEKQTYFVSLTSGAERPKSRIFWLLFQTNSTNVTKSASVDITAVSIYGHGSDQITEPISELRREIKTRRTSSDNDDQSWKWRMTMIGATAETISRPF